MTTPFPYQYEGAGFLAPRRGALLADEPRVGKTKSAIIACDLVFAEDVLWLTKGSARADHVKVWRETQQLPRQVTSIYAGNEPVPTGGVIITSYDLAAGALFDRLRRRRFEAIVTDESHRLKNLSAKRTQRVFGEGARRVGGLVENAHNAWALSGSPWPNNYAEIYPTARALFPESLRYSRGIMDYHTFERRFCLLRDDGFGLKIVGNRNAVELRERMAPYMLRREFAKLWPDASRPVTEFLFLDAHGILAGLEDGERALLVEELQPLLDAAEGDVERTDAILKEVERRLGPKIQRLTGEAKALPLAQWVAEQIEDGIGKVVIFAWHHSVIDALAKHLGKFKPVVIDGRTTGRQKDERQHRFQTYPDCQVAIGQIVAAGEAIDLSVADTAVFAEASWVPGDNDQAWRRIANVMKKSAVWVLFATLADSIDEKMQRANVRKMADINRVLKGVA